ncbi:Heat shock protein DnaJ-like [Synechococcus elongatus PCC 7942 = FACHB-805]|uniref:Heat shock protein DnaJ-like n=2 Tax=Synechococcus elongatus TaxID=32046 RepID=Q31KT3_SYNE7|nr:Heat shock protein DnaJ-like [Synechococcus elongatus PCC 7942 = FACHB-805]
MVCMASKSTALPQSVIDRATELADRYGIDRQVFLEFAQFSRSQKVSSRGKSSTGKQPPVTKVKPLSLAQLKAGVCQAFNCSTVTQLKKSEGFQVAIEGRDYDLRLKQPWLELYRAWVAVPPDERNEVGPNCINGIDVLKNFRPWIVFGLDPKKATVEDIKSAFRQLAKEHHPDAGGNPEVFSKLQQMRDSLLFGR